MQGQAPSESRSERTAWSFAQIWACFVAAAGISIVCINSWISWTHGTPLLEIATETVFYSCWIWCIVSLAQMFRVLRRLDASRRFAAFSRGRPDDPDELVAWKWGWQFAYAAIAALATMAALPLVDSLIRK
jgi:hypothetical protein